MDARANAANQVLYTIPEDDQALRETAQPDFACASRDSETALATWYRKYAPAIYAHCLRMLQSQAAARDATQETFVRVLMRGPRFLNDDDARRYLYRVSTNVCLNQLRKLKVHTRAAASLRVRTVSWGSVERQHADREFVAAVLDRCGEASATVAVMYYVNGLSKVEIAETLGVTRRTVFSRLLKVARTGQHLLGVAQPGKDRRRARQTHDGLCSALSPTAI